MAEEHIQQEEQKEKKCNCPAGAPAWMVTYSDLVTLLLTFFVLLLSMASMDPVKFTKASSSIKDALGIHSTPSHVDFAIPVLPSPPIATFSPVRQQTTKKIYEKVRSQIESLRLTKDVGVLKRDDDSIVLRINESVLFKPGQSKISLKSYPILRTIADIIVPLPMNLRIEGHTDDRQVSRTSYATGIFLLTVQFQFSVFSARVIFFHWTGWLLSGTAKIAPLFLIMTMRRGL